jgi:hypothetical protein
MSSLAALDQTEKTASCISLRLRCDCGHIVPCISVAVSSEKMTCNNSCTLAVCRKKSIGGMSLFHMYLHIAYVRSTPQRFKHQIRKPQDSEIFN